MGRKKKKPVKEKVFCWYCNRDFADEDTLVQHQRAKHFRCPDCNKQLNSAPGVAVHCRQVHKLEVSEVPDSLPGRSDITLTIFGMAGVPEDAVAQFKGEPVPAKRARLDVNDATGQWKGLTVQQQAAAQALAMLPPPAMGAMAMMGMPPQQQPIYGAPPPQQQGMHGARPPPAVYGANPYTMPPPGYGGTAPPGYATGAAAAAGAGAAAVGGVGVGAGRGGGPPQAMYGRGPPQHPPPGLMGRAPQGVYNLGGGGPAGAYGGSGAGGMGRGGAPLRPPPGGMGRGGPPRPPPGMMAVGGAAAGGAPPNMVPGGMGMGMRGPPMPPPGQQLQYNVMGGLQRPPPGATYGGVPAHAPTPAQAPAQAPAPAERSTEAKGRLVHPPDHSLSIEETRARLARYRPSVQASAEPVKF